MPKAGWKEIAVLLVCVSIPCCFSYVWRMAAGGQIQTIDFGEIYYGARCAMQHMDPYETGPMLKVFEAGDGHFAPGMTISRVDQIVVTRTVNLPTALFLTVPLAMLPWGIAQNVWMILMAALLVAAAFLTWDLGAGAAPLMWVVLAGFMLAECDLLFKVGNVAGVAVSLCVIAVWCFLRDRWVWAGVVLLALSLVLKPQDSGFVWLYFVLVGGVQRKRALQTLAVAAVLAACAALWIAPVSPHWIQEMHKNLTIVSTRGGTSDPGPSNPSTHTAGVIISLEGALSALKDDPHFYAPASYLICGILILVWGLTTLRKRFSMESARLALAAIVALILLSVYHRSYDAKLLLLALPACAMLWKKPGPKRWFALGLTAAAILLTATTPLAFLGVNYPTIDAFAAKLPGGLPAMFLLRPTPFVLFAMGCFYLWVYWRYEPGRDEPLAGTDTVAATQAP